jgi:threonine synthase
MNLKDGGAAKNQISSEAKKLRELVMYKSKSLVDRLESYENIINIEVGDTGLKRAKTLEREFDIRQLYIKYEGDNPTGTQKDRIAFAQVYDALRREYAAKSIFPKAIIPNGFRRWKDCIPCPNRLTPSR